jgi:hypothetical protein
LGEVSFLHESIGPDLLHQFVFNDCRSSFLQQGIEDIERFGGKRNRLAVPDKGPPKGVSPKGSELIEVSCFHRSN